MPQSLEAIVKTRLKMVNSLLREEGETPLRRMSLFFSTLDFSEVPLNALNSWAENLS